jgi:hypothetical protein
VLTAVSDHSGLSANRAGVLNAQSWRLIIVWLEVRVLPAPPRSLTQTEISRLTQGRTAEVSSPVVMPALMQLVDIDRRPRMSASGQ